MIHLLWVSILCCGIVHGKSYRLFEDPKKAPYALENWQIPSRISENQWVQFLKLRGTTPYTIKSGDTLSKISEEELGSQEFWPKLWEVNKEKIANPHLIEPEQVLVFVHPDSLQRKVASENEPKIKKTREELPDQLLRENFYNAHRMRFFLREGNEFVGVITGSYDQKDVLSLNSEVYVGVSNPLKIKIGERFAVVREVSSNDIPPQIDKEFGNNLVRLVGELEIIQEGKEFARAQVSSAYELLKRGDRLMSISPLEMKEPDAKPPGKILATIILGENLETTMISPGQLVLLNKGARAGMKAGFVFGVFEDTDPQFQKQDLLLPRSKGEVKIVQVGESWSTGLVRGAQDVLQTGDVLIAHDVFTKTLSPVIQKRSPVFIE